MRLRIENLSFAYKNELVLNNISFNANGGELISLIGKNGAGKSTLFKCVLGILNNYAGNIFINDKLTKTFTASQISKQIAYIPQLQQSGFNFSVLDIVIMGTKNRFSTIGVPGDMEETDSISALERLGIGHLKNRAYMNISGGERQLVLMARAIIQNAKIWILDEPMANLDYGNQLMVLNTLKKLSNDGYTIIQSTHNPEQAYKYSDRVLALHKGKKIADGKPEAVITGELLEKIYGIDVDICKLPNKDYSVFCPKISF